MKLVQLLFAIAAVAYVVGQYLQERKRLGLIQGMEARAAKALHERHRRRNDRVLLAITVVFCSGAAGTLIYAQWFHR